MKLRTPLALAGAAAMAITTGLVTTATTSQAAGTKSYAYGVAIGGQGKQPYAEHPAGPTSGGGQLPAELGPLAAGGILTVEADNNYANATVTNLTLGGGMEQLPQELRDAFQQLGDQCEQLPAEPTAEQLTGVFDAIPPGTLGDLVNTPEDLQSLCQALGAGDFTQLAQIETLDVECNGRDRSVEVLNARAFGSPVALNDSDVAPNSSLLPEELAPLIKITLNKQYTNDKGGAVVEGLVLEVGGQEVAVLASATCGETIRRPAEGRVPTRNRPAPAPQAEAPEPVRQSVPVTG